MSAMSEQTSIQLASLNSELNNVKKAIATSTEQERTSSPPYWQNRKLFF
ncbi:MAG: hypothetical protein K2J08_08295 [Ruminococcus sp.]|nr:hypothetical protein [Ruminococcus sp.]